MINSITIEGFRGIPHLQLRDLSDFNILIGRNGSGKTSVLEAVSIAANPVSPVWLGQLGRWRELPPISSNNPDGLLSAYPYMNPENPIRIIYATDEHERDFEITIEAKTGGRMVGDNDESPDSSPSTMRDPSALLTGIKQTLKSGRKIVAGAELTLLPNGAQSETKGDHNRKFLGAFYIHARRSTSLGETSCSLTELYSRRKQNQFIEAMRRVEPRLQNLVPGTRHKTPTVLADLGSSPATWATPPGRTCTSAASPRPATCCAAGTCLSRKSPIAWAFPRRARFATGSPSRWAAPRHALPSSRPRRATGSSCPTRERRMRHHRQAAPAHGRAGQ